MVAHIFQHLWAMGSWPEGCNGSPIMTTHTLDPQVDELVGLSAARREHAAAAKQLSTGSESARIRFARASHELEVAERRAYRLGLDHRWRARSWGV